MSRHRDQKTLNQCLSLLFLLLILVSIARDANKFIHRLHKKVVNENLKMACTEGGTKIYINSFLAYFPIAKGKDEHAPMTFIFKQQPLSFVFFSLKFFFNTEVLFSILYDKLYDLFCIILFFYLLLTNHKDIALVS